MSIWAGVKSMFGSSEHTGTMIDAVINTADALVFTDEEKSEVNKEIFKLRIEYEKASTGSRLARRYLALMVTGSFLFWFSIAAVFMCISAYSSTDSAMKAAEGIANLLTSLAVGGSFVTIISWYFFTGVSRGAAE